MSRYVYLNGRIVREREARIPVTDRALLHGYGLFETLRTYDGKPALLDQHLRRMWQSARVLGIAMPPISRRLPFDIARLIALNGKKDCAVRLTLTAGDGSAPGSFFVTTRDLPTLPPRIFRAGARVVVAPWRRSASSPIHGHKTLNYLENILARKIAARANAVDALFVDETNHVLEGSASNVFIVRRGTILTPPLRERILAGITRESIIRICRVVRAPLREEPFTVREMMKANEVFITNALIEVMPVTRIGKTVVGGGRVGPMAQTMRDFYRISITKTMGNVIALQSDA